MNDCSNAEIRDQLPDLLHERLDERARAVVIAHIATCIDCDEELQLLRDVLGLIETRTPRVDVSWIVSALPKPPAQVPAATEIVSANSVSAERMRSERTPNVLPITSRVSPRVSPRRRWADWRIAAAVTLLVAGGSSAVLLNRGAGQGTIAVAPAVGTETPSVSTPAVAAGAAPATAQSSAAPSVGQSTAPVAVEPAASSAVASADDGGDDRADVDLGSGSRLGDLDEQQLQTLLKDITKLPAVPVTEPEPVSLQVNTAARSSEGW